MIIRGQFKFQASLRHKWKRPYLQELTKRYCVPSRNKTNQERPARKKTNQELNKTRNEANQHKPIQERRQLGTMSSRNKDIQERNHLGTIFNKKIQLGTIFGYRLSPTFFYKKPNIVNILRTQKSFLLVRDIQERFLGPFLPFTNPHVSR